ncbi:MAG: hypothetical protein QM523_10920 [Candidatus Pacebacteria bacterium]|nr:hypothetical protein [Candidatus Paceibacterota bacterium]
MTIGYDPVPEAMNDQVQHRRKLAMAVNLLSSGKMNVTKDLSLRVNATETSLSDSRISSQSILILTPMSAAAAADMASIYIASQKQGLAVIRHPSRASAQRNFRVAILG